MYYRFNGVCYNEASVVEAINEEKDSIRFYQIGNQYRKKVEQVGVKETIFVEDPFIF